MARRYPKKHKRSCPNGHNLLSLRKKMVENKDGTKAKYVAYWCKRCEQNYVVKDDNEFFYTKE